MNEPDDITLDLGRASSLSEREESITPPQQIGRYRVEKVLGKGGFGLVYLAHDEQLDRRVAVKVPHARLINRPEDAELYLAEARTVAGLDHPHIVPVYDVGCSPEFPCYIVSKFIDGTDLATRLKRSPPDVSVSTEMVASIAEALHYAHMQGLVHRDVKPGNFLLGSDERAYIVDFGLALREADVGKGPRYAGTPVYMSPEQARGEGHRVDGRSDIYGLGTVLYELLTRRRTVSAETQQELLEQITSQEVKPPRQIDDRIPKELERICLKALAKRAADRYTTALDMAHDLRLCLDSLPQSVGSSSTAPPGRTSHDDTLGATGASSTAKGNSNRQNSDSQLIKIVPKGLRSFDAHDADFFLELLPGPRDREGLPDSLRFWKLRIEETDADSTFSVGLIYGPSGCGKSSLVKAGLLPRLSADIIPVYVEATPEETETRLLRGLRKHCPAVEKSLSLKETLAALRQGQGMPIGKKVLVVLDQFEQWLYAHKEESNTDLVQALRQCDGSRVQCIVMVRDDFWLAVSRFLRDLEVRLIEGENSALADLFDLDHARKVLGGFGRAFGKLPETSADTSQDQREFLSEAVAGLAEEGKVICVRLALFAEMMKGKTWTPAVLKEVGGTQGVGVTFLEETFSASTAPPEHRYHQKAARAVLRVLLPDAGADIKGHMRSEAELLNASGYANHDRDFADLMRILDGELRLTTPTDPEGSEKSEEGSEKEEGAAFTSSSDIHASRFFQLTHDYLVPSLRDWLTRKQKETRRGRAELKLADSSASWNAKTENRLLPSWWEHLTIRLLTDKAKWTEPQRKMMSRAGRVHGIRSALAVTALTAVIFVGTVIRIQFDQRQEATRVEGLVGQLVSAEPNRIPEIVADLDANPEVAANYLGPLLQREAKTHEEQRGRLHARLATVGRDSSQVDPLVEELLSGKVTYVLSIRQLLQPSAVTLTERFGEVLRNDKDPKRRFRAALALADYLPHSEVEFWTHEHLKFVAEQLLSSNAEYQPLLREALRPIRDKLLPGLEGVFADVEATDAQRLSAANAFADYAASDTRRLSRLLTVATPEQFDVLYPLVAASPSPSVVEELSKTAATLPPEDLGSVERITFGQRRANAAVALVRLGEREKVLPVFDYTDDPEALTQFIFRCRERGVVAEELLELLDGVTRSVGEEPTGSGPTGSRLADTSGYQSARALYALLLALGEFSLEEIPESRRESLVEQLADWYANDPSSGVHGAAGWLLRQWGQNEIATRIDQTPVPYSTDREWFTLAITVTPTQASQSSDEATADTDGEDSTVAEEEKPDEDKKTNSADEVTDPGAEQQEDESVAEPAQTKTFYYTFIVFQAGEYTIGSVADEPARQDDEDRRSIKFTRPFAILDREVTMAELIAFSTLYARYIPQFDASAEDAGYGLDWYDTVAFSRWLGQQNELPEEQQAYASPDTLDPEQYPREPNAKANWAPRNWPVNLELRGFRLPTESEWAVASRSGTRTAYGYGSDVGLLGYFGWYVENSEKRVHPTRERRPTGRGLFDTHGNLFEWTHDWFAMDLGAGALTDPTGPSKGSNRVGRGGGWGYQAGDCRTAIRNEIGPLARTASTGFRLALSPSGDSSPAEQEVGAETAGEGTEGASAEQRP